MLTSCLPAPRLPTTCCSASVTRRGPLASRSPARASERAMRNPTSRGAWHAPRPMVPFGQTTCTFGSAQPASHKPPGLSWRKHPHTSAATISLPRCRSRNWGGGALNANAIKLHAEDSPDEDEAWTAPLIEPSLPLAGNTPRLARASVGARKCESSYKRVNRNP